MSDESVAWGVRNPETGQRQPWLKPRKALRRWQEWEGDLPTNGAFDLELLPSKNTHRYIQELQRRAADQGATVSAEWQQMLQFPVDRQPVGMIAAMPRDERDVRDFHGKPLMLVDNRPGGPTQILVGNARRHLGDLIDEANERRHYGTDRPDYLGPTVDMQAVWEQWTERKRDHDAGRTKFSMSSADADNMKWVDDYKDTAPASA